MTHSQRNASIAVLLCAVACRSAPAPSSRASDAAPNSAAVAGAAGSYTLALPNRWKGHIRVDSLSTAERGTALPGAVVFAYIPTDSTIRPQALLVIAVYDSAAWQAVRAEAGPPPGDSVASQHGLVYVIALPQSNPFPPASPDAMVFDLLQLKKAELGGLIQLH